MQRCNSCITALLHMGFNFISTEDQQGQGLDLRWGLPSRLRGALCCWGLLGSWSACCRRLSARPLALAIHNLKAILQAMTM